RYKGRSRYYPGRIARIHRNGTCDIDYDDGEKERMVEPGLIKPLTSSSRSPTRERQGNDIPTSSNGQLEEGMRVEARYKGRSHYYPGRIARIHRNGTCDIDYDDGEKERMVEPSLIKPLTPSRSPRRGGRDAAERRGADQLRSNGQLEEGMKVKARYKGRRRYYPGRIARVHHDGTCDIDYDDGEKERMVEPTLIEELLSPSGILPGGGYENDREKVIKELEEGMKVEARYKGRSHYYPGRIVRIHRDGTCDIDYDDGEEEQMVEPALVRPLHSPPRSPRRGDREDDKTNLRPSQLHEGMKVEAKYKGRSRYLPGRISRVHPDGTCDIDYDDGEAEHMVEPSLIEPLASSRSARRISTDSGGGQGWHEPTTRGQLEEGMRVEARYRGRRRYYPGRIVRVHRDGTCDINYDDGEKEYMVDPGLIQPIGPPVRSPHRSSGVDNDNNSTRTKPLEEGMKVEARYKGRGRYYPGRIARIHQDGTCDIDYDDGEREGGVDPALIKHPPTSNSYRSRGSDVDGSSDNISGRLEEGMEVEARHEGRSHYHPGRIARIHRDGTCDIDYNDGEEYRVDPSLVRPLVRRSRGNSTHGQAREGQSIGGGR
ncbi:unnamed protein product, partial [Discosporangium mesarthrocarpum]